MSGKEKTRDIKPVSFNLLDPEELELHKHAEQINPLTGKKRNFSRYVRRLIAEDMRRQQQGGNGDNNQSNYTTIIDHQNDDDEDYTIEVKDAMNSFL